MLSTYGTSFAVMLSRLPMPDGVKLSWLLYLFALTALNDISQFIIGKTLGRHKIAASISPNKTWQGLLGGVATSTAVSLVAGSYMGLECKSALLVIGMALSLAGFCGDLVFSAAKRILGIKDFSQLIPGHGGILDRADSLVLTAPLLYFCIHFLYSL
jgi:phosphatidate cytidylyltransferase